MTTLTNTDRDGADSLTGLFSCLANGPRRLLLGLVSERAPVPVARDELARYVAALTREKARDQVTEVEHQQAVAALHHVHLPKLEAADLLDQDTERDAITRTDHPAFRDPGVRTVIGDENADDPSLDALFASLADSRRRTILDVLSHQYQPIQTETLARELVARDKGTSERNVTPEATEQMLGTLLHIHLPNLAEAGLISYDADEQRVAYEGHPVLRVPWMHSQLSTDFRASLTDEPQAENVWTLEDRENIVSYGQSLCERADEELFLMFTATGLLEAGCFTRIRNAVDRGVKVYLGTSDQAVREFVQQKAPEVTLWEPRVDWLNLPVEEDKVGRLVFADREAIMLATLSEQNKEGVHSEQALIGEGADNAFVVLMRQMLRSHLDQFDAESEKLQSHLPF